MPNTRRVVTTQSQSSDNNLKIMIIIGSIVLGAALLAWMLFLNLREPPAISGLVTFPELRAARGHDETIEYEFEALPPAGGTHNPVWQNCGIYLEPIEPEHAIHSMEHGTVWIAYQPDLAEEDVITLEDKVRGQNFLLLSPYPNLRSPVILTAWGLQLEVDSVNDRRIDEFIERYRVGPQTPERGATCANGTGTPQ